MKQKKIICVNTKLPEPVFNIVDKICKDAGTSIFELIRYFCLMLIELRDTGHPVDPDVEKLMHTFNDLEAIKDKFNICDPDAEPVVREATYYIQNGKCRQDGYVGMLVKEPFFGVSEYTFNKQTICERMFCLLFDNLYKRLRKVGTEINTSTVVETIEQMVEDYEALEDRRAIDEIFGTHYDGKHEIPEQAYERHMHYTPESPILNNKPKK